MPAARIGTFDDWEDLLRVRRNDMLSPRNPQGT